VQKFYSALQESLRNPAATQLLDDVTIAKIQSLILEEGQLNEKALYEKVLKNEAIESLQGEFYKTEDRFPQTIQEYYPLRLDMGDTQKIGPMSKRDYEEFLEDMEDKLMKDNELNEGPERLMGGAHREEEAVEEEEGGSAQDALSREEQEDYNEFLGGIKKEMLKTSLGSDGEKSAFKFDRATEDLYGFKDRIALEKEERARAL
jgi:hypothetical protein